MKGPYERLKYNLQRVWECPKCQQRQRTDGTITALQCPCQLGLTEDQRVSMTLMHDGIRRSKVKQPAATPTPATTPKAAADQAETPAGDTSTDPRQPETGKTEPN